LYVEVGGPGNGAVGGWNGGAVGGSADNSSGGGGGGASDVRTTSCGSSCVTGGSADSLNSRLVAAAGGGGGGGALDSNGGPGGPAGSPGGQGQTGIDSGGAGGSGGGAGTSTQGGTGGAGSPGGPGGQAGAFGQGGPGGTGGTDLDGGGGGGGGGYYGGGGGGDGLSSSGGGGGGGSSLAPDGSTGVDTTGTPLVTISYTSSNTVTVTNPGNQTSTVGTAVSLQIQATDSAGGQTLTYRATGLPAGLSISSSSGLISGTPTSAGTSSITVTATDTTGASGSASFTWTVTPAPLEVTTTSLPGATLGSAYSATLAATGGTPPYSWSVSAGSLPPGLSLSSSGTISGTPAEAGTYSLTIQAADSSSPRQTATAQLSITVGGCTTSITGSHTGQIVVGKGQFVCIGPNASQNGAITVNSGGGLSVVSSTLTGGISAGGAVSLGLSGSTINGSVSLTGNHGPSVVSGNTIVGSLACSGNNPPPVDNGQANKVSGKSSGQCSALG
jgi:hypothetical protein